MSWGSSLSARGPYAHGLCACGPFTSRGGLPRPGCTCLNREVLGGGLGTAGAATAFPGRPVGRPPGPGAHCLSSSPGSTGASIATDPHPGSIARLRCLSWLGDSGLSVTPFPVITARPGSPGFRVFSPQSVEASCRSAWPGGQGSRRADLLSVCHCVPVCVLHVRARGIFQMTILT